MGTANRELAPQAIINPVDPVIKKIPPVVPSNTPISKALVPFGEGANIDSRAKRAGAPSPARVNELVSPSGKM